MPPKLFRRALRLFRHGGVDNPAFQQGTKFDQLVAAVDLIIRF